MQTTSFFSVCGDSGFETKREKEASINEVLMKLSASAGGNQRVVSSS